MADDFGFVEIDPKTGKDIAPIAKGIKGMAGISAAPDGFEEIELPEERGDFRRGLAGGIESAKAMAGGATALAGMAAAKVPGLGVPGRAVAEYGMEIFKERTEEAAKYAPKQTLKEVWEKPSVGGAVDWAQYTFGSLVPSMAEAAIGAATGAAIGTVAAPGPGTVAGAGTGLLSKTVVKSGMRHILENYAKKRLGKVVAKEGMDTAVKTAAKSLGAKTGVVLTTAQMEAGGMFGEDIERRGLDEANIYSAAGLGLAAGAVELFGGNIGLIDNILGSTAARKASEALAKGKLSYVSRLFREAIKNVPQEMMQEGTQALLSIANQFITIDDEKWDSEKTWNVIESSAAGALPGLGGALVKAAFPGRPGPVDAEEPAALPPKPKGPLAKAAAAGGLGLRTPAFIPDERRGVEAEKIRAREEQRAEVALAREGFEARRRGVPPTAREAAEVITGKTAAELETERLEKERIQKEIIQTFSALPTEEQAKAELAKAEEVAIADPIHALRSEIKKRGGLNLGSLKIDYDEETTKAVIAKLPGIVSRTGKVELDDIADEMQRLGYESADELLLSLAGRPTRKAAVSAAEREIAAARDFEDRRNEQVDQLEREGFDPVFEQKPAVDLNKGDKVVTGQDPDLPADTYEVKGVTVDGKVVLQDGVKREVDGFDTLNVEGVKRSGQEGFGIPIGEREIGEPPPAAVTPEPAPSPVAAVEGEPLPRREEDAREILADKRKLDQERVAGERIEAARREDLQRTEEARRAARDEKLREEEEERLRGARDVTRVSIDKIKVLVPISRHPYIKDQLDAVEELLAEGDTTYTAEQWAAMLNELDGLQEKWKMGDKNADRTESEAIAKSVDPDGKFGIIYDNKMRGDWFFTIRDLNGQVAGEPIGDPKDNPVAFGGTGEFTRVSLSIKSLSAESLQKEIDTRKVAFGIIEERRVPDERIEDEITRREAEAVEPAREPEIEPIPGVEQRIEERPEIGAPKRDVGEVREVAVEAVKDREAAVDREAQPAVGREPAPDIERDRERGELKIEDISETSIIITGETEKHESRIKDASKVLALWNEKRKGWVYPKAQESKIREKLDDLLALPPIVEAEPFKPVEYDKKDAEWHDLEGSSIVDLRKSAKSVGLSYPIGQKGLTKDVLIRDILEKINAGEQPEYLKLAKAPTAPTVPKSTTKELKAQLDKDLGKRGRANLNLEVVQTVDELMGKIGIGIKRAADPKTKGAFNPRTGKSYLVADNVSLIESWPIALHEGVHKIKETTSKQQNKELKKLLDSGEITKKEYANRRKDINGWSGVFGRESAGIMRDIDAKIKANDPAWKAAGQKAIDAGTAAKDIREETIAYYLTNNANRNQSLWRRIVNAIRAWAVRMGIKRKVTDADIVALAELSIQRAARQREWIRPARARKAAPAIAEPLFAKEGIRRHLKTMHPDKLRDLVQTLDDNAIDVVTKQKALAKHIQQQLPISERGRRDLIAKITKLGTPKTVATREKYLQQALELIDQRHEEVAKKQTIEKIQKLIKSRGLPKKISGKPVGKLSPDAHKFVEDVRKHLIISAGDAAVQLERLIGVVGEDLIDLSPDQQRRLVLLSYFTNLEGRTSSEVEAALSRLQDVIKTGREWWLDTEATRKEEMSAWRKTAHNEFTGGKDVEAEKDKSRLNKNKLWEKIKSAARTFDDNSQSWTWLLDKFSRFSKDDGTLTGETTKRFSDMQFSANENFDTAMRERGEEITNAAQRIFGLKGRKLVSRLNENIVVMPKTGVIVNGVEKPLSQNEAYKLWQWISSPSLSGDMEKHGYDEKVKSQLESYMTPEVKTWAEWQIDEFYHDFREKRANPAYRDRFHIDMANIHRYSPMVRDRGGSIEDDMLLESKTYFASEVPGAVKSRTANRYPPKIVDGDMVLMNHITQMEHFIAWTKPIQAMRSVLTSGSVLEAIEAFHGHGAKKAIMGFVDDFARGGLDRAQSLRGLDKLRSNVVVSMIGLNPVVFMKQLASFPAYMLDMPVSKFIGGTFDLFSNPAEISSKVGLLVSSKHLKNRYKLGHERDIVAALHKSIPENVAGKMNLRDLFMLPTKIGDGAAIVLGGWSFYKYRYDQHIKTMSKEEAQEKALFEFAQVTNRNQQSGHLGELGGYQRGGSMFKLMTMFMTTQQQYYRNVAGGYRNLFAGRGKRSDNIKRVAIAHFLLPMIFQFIASGLKWDDEDQLRAALIGPLNGLFLVRDGFEALMRGLTSGKTYFATGRSPVFSMYDNIGNVGKEAHKLLTEDPAADVLDMIDEMAGVMAAWQGVPYRPVKKVTKGLYDASTGKTEYPVRRSIGFSEKALERGSVADKSRKQLKDVLNLFKRFEKADLEEKKKIRTDSRYSLILLARESEKRLRKLNKIKKTMEDRGENLELIKKEIARIRKRFVAKYEELR